MSEKGQKAYHHGDLRQAILEAACSYLRNDNADTLSLRAIAREIGVSQTAPYRHFDSRNALFAGIATWGFQILEKRLQTSLVESLDSSPFDQLVEMGMVYLHFAVEHYEKYQLFFDSSLVDFDEYPDLQAASSACFDLMLNLIIEGKRAGIYRDEDEEHLAAVVWSGLHGVASLLQINRHRAAPTERPVGRAIQYLVEERRAVLEAQLQAIMKQAAGS